MNVHAFTGSNQGCPALTPGEGQQVDYMCATLTCRGEYEPYYYCDTKVLLISKNIVECGDYR